jgi:5-hydroxyisourate hydrolase
MAAGSIMSTISTHVLDTALGAPGIGIPVTLETLADGIWTSIAQSATDTDGRVRSVTVDAQPGRYRLTFHLHDYFAKQGRTSLYPAVTIVFHTGSDAHYHLPLLLSDNSYTTYRGS